MEITPTIVFIALLGGVLPAIFWLWFWLKEDLLHPEPRSLIILSFMVGMLATGIAYPLEKCIAIQVGIDPNYQILSKICRWMYINGGDLTLLSIWAFIEETLKFGGIYVVALRTKFFDEPIDGVIYLMTIALGFAALENTMFLFNPLGDGDAIATILLGNYRFIGATLLHVAASGIVGVALALSFYETRREREIVGFCGLVLAILLHIIFNFSIIVSKGSFLNEIFIALWTLIVGILLVCEKIKRMAPRSHVLYPKTGMIVDMMTPINTNRPQQ